MGRIFRYDSPIMLWLQKISSVIFCGFFWLLCCIPVITAGAATTAMYRMMFNLRQDKSARIKDFFHVFAAEFGNSTLIWITDLLSIGIIGALFYLVMSAGLPDLPSYIFVVLILILFVFWLFTFSLVYAYTSYFVNSVGQSIRNSLLMAAANLKYSIPVLAIGMSPLTYLVLIFILQSETLLNLTVINLLPVWLFVIFPLIRYWQSYFLQKIFERYVSDKEA